MTEGPVAVSLEPAEREMLMWGLGDWGGPAACTDTLAVAMGFDSCADLRVQTERLLPLLRSESPLTPSDWTRTLLATEIVWASDVVGAGMDASATFGHSDVDALRILRSLQGKLVAAGVISRPPR